MAMKEVLLTGGLGFIGKHLLGELLRQNIIVHLIIRPGKRIPDHLKSDLIHPIYLDLARVKQIEEKIGTRRYDTIFHIAAIRGGRRESREIYRAVNVDATQLIATMALNKPAKLIYCSSVGVFGAIPKQLPPTDSTQRQGDNYYHHTKILAETALQKLKGNGLEFVILRPSITYGKDDFGFPYSLIHLINKGIFFNCAGSVKINMIDINTLVQAFINAARLPVKHGAAYNICDKHPVELKALVNFISRELAQKNYPRIKTLPSVMFRAGEAFFDKIIKNDLWRARFQLISRSWYFDPKPAMKDLSVIPKETIPNFKYVIDWYKRHCAAGN